VPIYEYRCSQCGEISEMLVGAGPGTETLSCKHCGSGDLEKILSVSSFTFKDGGRAPGTTCCGRDERCDSPPCTTGEICRRDR
jgi:putative FmdB family regulatory protein